MSTLHPHYIKTHPHHIYNTTPTTPHLQHIHITSTPHPQHLHTSTTTHQQHIHTSSTTHQQHIHTSSTTHQQHIHTSSTTHQQHIHTSSTTHQQHARPEHIQNTINTQPEHVDQNSLNISTTPEHIQTQSEYVHNRTRPHSKPPKDKVSHSIPRSMWQWWHIEAIQDNLCLDQNVYMCKHIHLFKSYCIHYKHTRCDVAIEQIKWENCV